MYNNGRHREYKDALRTFLDGAAKRLPGLIFTGEGFVFGDPDETPYVVGYTYGFLDGDYEKYHVAQESMQICLKAAESLKNIKTSFSRSRVEQISNFNGLRSNFIEELKSSFDTHMSGDKSVSALLPPAALLRPRPQAAPAPLAFQMRPSDPPACRAILRRYGHDGGVLAE